MEKVPEIFISYAHVDDGQPSGRFQWVQRFREFLEDFVNQRLERRDSVTIWRDVGSLDKNKGVTPQIEKAIQNSKILVILFSPKYRHSQWCREELELFKRANPGPDGLNGRLFIVRLDEKPPRDFDPVLGDFVGYEFYSKPREGAPVTRLGFPVPKETDSLFTQALDGLAADLARQIENLSDPIEEGSGDGEAQAGRQNSQSAEAIQCKVVLADPTPDLVYFANKAYDFLTSKGVQVLWRRIAGRSDDDYKTALRSDLNQASYFIQFLGPFPFSRFEGFPAEGDRLQLELAREKSVKIFRWRPEHLDFNSESLDKAQKEFITMDDVKAMDLDVFLGGLVAELDPLSRPSTHQDGGANHELKLPRDGAARPRIPASLRRRDFDIPPDEMPQSPFVGLRSFEPDDWRLFHGREEHVEQMLEDLRENRFLAVVGDSGCGKSSLIRAGLIPALRQGDLIEGSTRWHFIVFRPENDPYTHFAEGILRALEGLGKQEEIPSVSTLVSQLRRSPLGLIDVLDDLQKKNVVAAEDHSSLQVLVVVDQFEELFRFRRTGDSEGGVGVSWKGRSEASSFVNLLLTSARELSSIPIYIVITLRSDYIGECNLFHGLPEAMNDGQFLTPRMTRVQLQAAIEQPLKQLKAFIEPEVLNSVLNELSNDPDHLPLMQHALRRAWKTAKLQGRLIITHEDYDFTGGLGKAISKHGEEILKSFRREESMDIASAADEYQPVARNLFLCLVDRGSSGHLVRRISNIREVCEISGASEEMVFKVVRAFADPDSSFIRVSDVANLDSETQLEVTHEALFRNWDILQTEWLPEEEQAVETYRRLADSARQWKAGKEDLLVPPRLDISLEWSELKHNKAWLKRYDADDDLALEFLKISKEHFEKEERRKQEKSKLERQIALTVIIFTILGLLAILLLWLESRRKGSQLAEQNEVLVSQQTKLTNTLNILEEQKVDLIRQREEAQKQTRKAQIEEGRAWIERANFYSEQKNSFFASLMAARAIGFEGYGRDSFSEEMKELYPQLVKTSSKEEGEGLGILSTHALRPIWSSLISFHHRDTINSIACCHEMGLLASGGSDNSIRIWEISSGKLVIALNGHGNAVNSIAFNQGGHLLASGSSDNTVKIWEVSSGRLLKTLEGHKERVNSVAFSPDGRVLASGSDDQMISIWDMVDLQLTFKFDSSHGSVKSLSFSQDGQILASGGYGKVHLWEMPSGKGVQVLDGHTDWVNSVAFSPSEQQLASAGDDGLVLLWETSSGQQIERFKTSHDSVICVTFSPDGRTLATSGSDETIEIWDLSTTDRIRAFNVDHGWITSVTFSPDGKYLVSGGSDQSLHSWNVHGDSNLNMPLEHTDLVRSINFSPGGHYLSSAGIDGIFRVWDISTGRQVFALDAERDGVSCVGYSPDFQTIAFGAISGEIEVWDVPSSRRRFTLFGHLNLVRSVAFSPDGSTLASGGNDKKIHLWDIASGQKIRTFDGHNGWIQSIKFSPDGYSLCTGTRDGAITIWDIASGHALNSFNGHLSGLEGLAFNPNGSTLATFERNSISLWNVSSNQIIRKLEDSKVSIKSLTFSPDGNTLASGGDGVVTIWEISSGQILHSLEVGQGLVYSLSYSPDCRTLALGVGGCISLWEIVTGQLVHSLEGHSGPCNSIAFSPRGNTLASGGSGVIKCLLWDVSSGQLIQALHGITSSINCVAFSPDGKSLTLGKDDGVIEVWDMDTMKHQRNLVGHLDHVYSISFSPDGQTLVSGGYDGEIINWDFSIGKVTQKLARQSGDVRSVSFSPYGSLFASGGLGGRIHLWAESLSQKIWELDSHSPSVNTLDFSFDGESLVSSGDDGIIKFWEMSHFQRTQTTLWHQGGVNSIDLSPDGGKLVSGGKNGTIQIWQLQKTNPFHKFQGHQGDVSCVTFSPKEGVIASSSRKGGEIKIWNAIHQIDWAQYLANGWLTIDGNQVTWNTTTDNLYRSKDLGFANVSPYCHIGILQSDLSTEEKDERLFWSYLNAKNFPASLFLLPRLSEAKKSPAALALAKQLVSDAETNSQELRNMALFRLTQADQALQFAQETAGSSELGERIADLRSRLE